MSLFPLPVTTSGLVAPTSYMHFSAPPRLASDPTPLHPVMAAFSSTRSSSLPPSLSQPSITVAANASSNIIYPPIPFSPPLRSLRLPFVPVAFLSSPSPSFSLRLLHPHAFRKLQKKNLIPFLYSALLLILSSPPLLALNLCHRSIFYYP